MVEADESDGSFLRLKSTVAVVTNIDPEHLDHYGDFDAVKKAFRDFVENIPFYGFAAVCLDHPEVQAMAAAVENRRLVTYGVNPQAEVRALRRRDGPDWAPSSTCCIQPRDGDVDHASSGCACRCRAGTTSPTRWPPSPWRASWASATDAIREGLAGLRRREAALHHHRRGRRRAGDRRLRPPSGGDRRRAEGRARR